MNRIQENVNAGAAYMDEKHPGWHDLIDLERLDLAWGWPLNANESIAYKSCILCQIHKKYFCNACLDEFGVYLDHEITDNLGFTAEKDVSYDELTECWKREILKRRGESPINLNT